MVPADKTLFPVCVAETMDWYKEGDVNSYDEAPAYPSKNPTGYSRVNMCVQYCTQVKNASPRQWEPSARILHSFYGYINASNAGSMEIETDLYAIWFLCRGRVVEPSGIIEKLWILKLTVG